VPRERLPVYWDASYRYNDGIKSGVPQTVHQGKRAIHWALLRERSV